MKALLFKKLIDLKSNKIRLLVFLTLPFLCFLLFFCCEISKEKLTFYFPMAVGLLNPIVFWEQENVFLSTDIVLTPISPKKAWIINSLIMSITYFLYSTICLFILLFINFRFWGIFPPFETILYGFLNIIFVFSITLFSSLSNIENTTIKQWIASFASILIFCFLPFFLCFNRYLTSNFNASLVLNSFGIVLIGLALIINKKIKNENILLFADKLFSFTSSRFVK